MINVTSSVALFFKSVAELTFLNESHDIREDSGHVNVCVNGTIKGVIFGLSVNASRSELFTTMQSQLTDITGM